MTTQAIHATALPREIQRYRRRPRVVHALLASSFLLLLITGMVLFLPPLSQYAAGGLSRYLHRIGALLYMAVPIVYLILDRHAAKELLWDSFRYDRDDIEWFKQSYRYFMGYTADMPPQGRLNAGQKLHHAGVVIFSATIVASGIILWVGKGSLSAQGLAVSAMIHDLSMLTLTILLVGHVYFTFVYKALSGMVTGYVPTAEAKLEHAKWVAELEEQPAPESAAKS